MMRFRFWIAAFAVCAAPLVLAQAPTEPALDEPGDPSPTLILRELLVIQADRYDTTANNAKLQSTALPAGISKTGRQRRIDDDGGYDYSPMPLGILTFEGVIPEPMTLRLQLSSAAGGFQAFFPDSDAIAGKQHLGWDHVREADDNQRAEPFGEQGAWLEALRESEDRVWIQSRDKLRKERFFLYDASFRFKPAINLSLNNNAYKLKTDAPERSAPPVSILIQKTDAGWAAGNLSAPWSSTTPVIANKPDPNTPTIPLNQALTPIKDLLSERGYNPQETRLALDMIASAGLDKSNMSLVYVLPVGIIDDHVYLKVKPEPDKIIRTAIVVVNNVDPDLGSQVNALIDDLGSDEWIKRERAQHELINLGQAAIKKVQQLKNDQDPEVAFRARQILNAYDWKTNGNK